MKNKQTISILIAILLLAITFSANAQNTVSPEFTKFWSELQKDKKATAQSYCSNNVIINGNMGEMVSICNKECIDSKVLSAIRKKNISKFKVSNDMVADFAETCEIEVNGKSKTISSKDIFKVLKINVESEFYSIQFSVKDNNQYSVTFAKVNGVFKIVLIDLMFE